MNPWKHHFYDTSRVLRKTRQHSFSHRSEDTGRSPSRGPCADLRRLRRRLAHLNVRPWEKSLSWQARGGRVKCIRFALRNCRFTASPAPANVSRHWALTVSRPFTNLTCITLHVVSLIILRVADLAAASLDGLFEHPACTSIGTTASSSSLTSEFKTVFQQPARADAHLLDAQGSSIDSHR